MILWSGRTIFFLQKQLDFASIGFAMCRHMMTHLPEPVSEQDIMEMFRFKEDFHIQRKFLQSIFQLRGQEQGRSNIIR